MALKRKVDLASGVLLALLGVVKCLFKGRVHCTPSFSRISDWRWNSWRLVAFGLSLTQQGRTIRWCMQPRSQQGSQVGLEFEDGGLE